MKVIKLTAISVAVLASTAAMAHSDAAHSDAISNPVIDKKIVSGTAANHAAVSAEVSLLGYGANVAWGVNETTEIQAGWSGVKVGDDVANLLNRVSGKLADVSAELGAAEFNVDFSNPYVGVQLRPAANWITVGAGVIVPNNKITANIDVKEKKSNLGGAQYDFKDVNFGVEFKHKNKLAPYATVGFRPNINNTFGVFGEVGGAYMGKADTKITVKTNATAGAGTSTNTNGQSSSSVTTDAKGAEDFAKALEKTINAKDKGWFPIVKVGATYRF